MDKLGIERTFSIFIWPKSGNLRNLFIFKRYIEDSLLSPNTCLHGISKLIEAILFTRITRSGDL
jgi:hypothetical protein